MSTQSHEVKSEPENPNVDKALGQRRLRIAFTDVAVTLAVIGGLAILINVLFGSETSPVISDAGAMMADASQVITRDSSSRFSSDTLSSGSSEFIAANSQVPYVDVMAAIEGAESRERDLVLVGQGWVEELAPLAVGEKVTRGQLLMKIYSPSLIDAQLRYLQALKSADAINIQSAFDQLTVHGQTDRQIQALPRKTHFDGLMRVRAPSDGVVSAVYVSEGMFIPMAGSMMRMVDMSSVWMTSELSLLDAAGIRPGRQVLAHVPGQSIEMSGVVEFIEPVGQGNQRKIRARLRFDGAQTPAIANDYVDVRIFGSELAVPQ